MRARLATLSVLAVASLGALFAACGSGHDGAAPPAASDGGADASGPAKSDATADGPPSRGRGDVVLLTLSDWRGQVAPLDEPADGGAPGRYGGLAALTTAFLAERAAAPGALLLSTGNAFGSTPLVSSATGDKLAATGLGMMGLNVGALGPHELDRGTAKLSALLDLGAFRVTATNLDNVSQALGPQPVTPFLLYDVGDADAGRRVKLAILGLTDFRLADLQFASNLDKLAVKSPMDLAGTAAAANEAAANARLVGADVVIALTNVGVGDASGPTPQGPLLDLARALKGVDVLVGGETDRAITVDLGSLLVMQNRSRGRTYGRIRLRVDGGAVQVVSADVVEPRAYAATSPICDAGADGGGACRCPLGPCAAGATCNAASGLCETELIAPNKDALDAIQGATAAIGPLLDTAIATATDAFPRDGVLERKQETALGDLVADAMRARYGAQIAFVPGSRLGAPLPSAYKAPDALSRATAPFDLVVGDVDAFLLPDVESAVVRQLTGQTLWQILEASVARAPAPAPAFLQVSGLSFSYTTKPDAGSRVKTVTLDGGRAIAPNDATLYTVVLTETLSRGDLGYRSLAEPVPTPSRELLSDIVVELFKQKSPLTPPLMFTRIVNVP